MIKLSCDMFRPSERVPGIDTTLRCVRLILFADFVALFCAMQTRIMWIQLETFECGGYADEDYVGYWFGGNS